MRFVANPNLARELEREPSTNTALSEAAGQARAEAQRIAPVEHPGGGAYRDGIVVDEVGGVVRLDATDWKSHWVEWGSVNNPVFAPLRRGVRGAGFRLNEQGR